MPNFRAMSSSTGLKDVPEAFQAWGGSKRALHERTFPPKFSSHKP